MDAKNWEAIERGREWMLWKFASLPIEKGPMEKFLQQYGELHPGLEIRECQIFVKIFQSAWRAETYEDKARISHEISAIFERDTSPLQLPRSPEKVQASWGGLPPYNSPRLRPAVTADFTTGTVTIKPRTLLDWLAKWLLECRDRLAICERKGCEHPYLVKAHARQRFCCPQCADAIRQRKKEQWWAENRDRFLKKWRQERKAGKRGKRG